MTRANAACLSVLGLCSAAWGAEPSFTLSSPDLPPGKPIAEQFTANAFGCHGPNQSPALKWSNAPAGTKPVSGWWHWVVYDIPATATQLPHGAGTPGNSGMPQGAQQGRPDGDAPEAHYYGPCPDEGDPPHHYTITVYALSVEHLKVPGTSTAANIDYEISTKTLAKATIVRLFSRPKQTP